MDIYNKAILALSKENYRLAGLFLEEARPQVETEGMPLPQPPGSAYQKRRILEKKIENVRKS